MDLTWITFMFLPLALVFTLVFSIGILIFLFYSLLRDSEERKGSLEPTKNQNIGSGKSSSGRVRARILKSIFNFSFRKRGDNAQVMETEVIKQDSTDMALGTEPSKVTSQAEETTKTPALVSSIPEGSEKKSSEDMKGKISSSVNEHANKMPDKSDKTVAEAPKSEAKKSPDLPNEPTQIKPKLVEDLSEVESLMSKKTTLSTQNKKEVPEKSEQTPSTPSKSSTPDSDDVLALLGGTKSAESEDRNEPVRISENVEKELKPPKVEKDKKNQKPENSEVESLLRSEEAVDKVEEIQDQFLELRTSLVQLKTTLKKLSEKEADAEKSAQ
ncbi:MAG: hypothetical protein N3D12_06175 [Candidatus Methanomethyliaceae archaeon]|nr:hypothetical protein [Candidatus Methanomethyliaceae archaeon]